MRSQTRPECYFCKPVLSYYYTLQVILASAFIPIFSGWLPPRYRGIRVIDGGYSDNLPVLDTNTVTVSPFCGNSDICPQDDYILTVLQVGKYQSHPSPLTLLPRRSR